MRGFLGFGLLMKPDTPFKMTFFARCCPKSLLSRSFWSTGKNKASQGGGGTHSWQNLANFTGSCESRQGQLSSSSTWRDSRNRSPWPRDGRWVQEARPLLVLPILQPWPEPGSFLKRSLAPLLPPPTCAPRPSSAPPATRVRAGKAETLFGGSLQASTRPFSA